MSQFWNEIFDLEAHYEMSFFVHLSVLRAIGHPFYIVAVAFWDIGEKCPRWQVEWITDGQPETLNRLTLFQVLLF